MKIDMGPTGQVIKGHVLDVDRKHFNATLKELDPQLYTHWNPKKLKGWGCWEIRRRPTNKMPVDYAIYKNNIIVRVDYLELSDINHILDCAFLNYDQIRKLKEMDTWTNKNHFLHDTDYRQQKLREEIVKNAREERKYMIKYYKSAFKDLRERVMSGENLASIVMGNGKNKWVHKD